MSIDLTMYLVVTAASLAIGLGALYFVIKTAIKNALSEDREKLAQADRLREFQAKVDRAEN